MLERQVGPADPDHKPCTASRHVRNVLTLRISAIGNHDLPWTKDKALQRLASVPVREVDRCGAVRT